MPRGRPAIYPDLATARRFANQRAKARAQERGHIQRSLTLPADCWDRIRAARAPGETSDAQTLTRLLHMLEGDAKLSNPGRS